MWIHYFEEELKDDRILTLRCFNYEIKTFGIIFALVGKSDSPQLNTEPRLPEIQALLNDFTDITPTELPKTLPPAQDIQHVIDLMSSATLLNMIAYKMNLVEQKELQRQI